MGQSDRMRAGPNSEARAGTTINRDPQSGDRGTIESVDGNNLTVTARDGTTQKIGLASDVVVTDLVKTTLADV